MKLLSHIVGRGIDWENPWTIIGYEKKAHIAPPQSNALFKEMYSKPPCSHRNTALPIGKIV